MHVSCEKELGIEYTKQEVLIGLDGALQTLSSPEFLQRRGRSGELCI